MNADPTPIRNASTVIVLRDRLTEPRVLMGQRGSNAVFMPNKVVFPGGAVDIGDAHIPLSQGLPAVCVDRLVEDCASDLSHSLAAAAIRELWEETGLIVGKPGTWDGAVPEDWQGFSDAGFVPSGQSLQFIFRAITPPGRPRRFDARFFLIDADEIANDLDDFSAACEELSHLQWVPIHKAREFDLPFITEVVMAEVLNRAADPSPPASIPFFRNLDEQSLFVRLKGKTPLQLLTE